MFYFSHWWRSHEKWYFNEHSEKYRCISSEDGGDPWMRFSHRLFLLLILLLTGAPILAQEPSDVAKTCVWWFPVLSVTPAGLRYQGHQSYVSFHLHVLVPPYKRMPRHLCLICLSSFTLNKRRWFQAAMVLFWQRVTDIPDGINRTISVKGVIINCRTKYRVHYW